MTSTSSTTCPPRGTTAVAPYFLLASLTAWSSGPSSFASFFVIDSPFPTESNPAGPLARRAPRAPHQPPPKKAGAEAPTYSGDLVEVVIVDRRRLLGVGCG